MTKVIVGTRETSAWPHFGGSIWVRLQYVLGLERLGLEPYLVDRLSTPDPAKNPHSVEYLADRLRRTAEDFGFDDRYCVSLDDGARHFGMSENALSKLVADAQLLINIGGYLPPGSELEAIPRRAFLDVDPGFTQLWALEVDLNFDRHNFFFTTGQNVGGPGFGAPVRDVAWKPTLPPVVLDHWPPAADDSSTRISTVADWRGSQDVVYDGEWYGGKREEFLSFLRVPEEAGCEIELALLVGQEDYEDLGLLLRHGWRVHDPYAWAGDPHSYREFIQRSRAEFSVAKRGYVRTRCGWVSDRTAAYLASGKPAVVQSTGFERRLPVGDGLLTFETFQEAVEALRSVDERYSDHAAAARRIAESHFDSDRVLGALLDEVALGL